MEIENTCAILRSRGWSDRKCKKMAGVGRLIRSVWPRISSAGAASSSLSVERSSQLPRLLARAAGGLPHQGDEPYTAEPPPVAGTWCMLLLLSRSRGARLVHTCMSSAMHFPYELTGNSVAKVLNFGQTWYLCYPQQYATFYTFISAFRVLFEWSWLFLTVQRIWVLLMRTYCWAQRAELF